MGATSRAGLRPFRAATCPRFGFPGRCPGLSCDAALRLKTSCSEAVREQGSHEAPLASIMGEAESPALRSFVAEIAHVRPSARAAPSASIMNRAVWPLSFRTMRTRALTEVSVTRRAKLIESMRASPGNIRFAQVGALLKFGGGCFLRQSRRQNLSPG